jgi:hypothetical protein
MATTLRCRGGPLDGRECVTRFPDGFVLIRKGAQWWAWWYRVGADRSAHADREPEAIARERVREVANGERFDVIAYDPQRMAPW